MADLPIIDGAPDEPVILAEPDVGDDDETRLGRPAVVLAQAPALPGSTQVAQAQAAAQAQAHMDASAAYDQTGADARAQQEARAKADAEQVAHDTQVEEAKAAEAHDAEAHAAEAQAAHDAEAQNSSHHDDPVSGADTPTDQTNDHSS